MKKLLRLFVGGIARLFTAASTPARTGQRSQPTLDALEPRVLFSGAPVEVEEEESTAPAADVQVAENPIQQGTIADQTGSDQNPAGPEASAPVTLVPLNAETLRAIADAAEQRWIAAGLSAEQLGALDGVTYEIGDLDGNALGRANGLTITIDRDAAGSNAWFIDATPLADEEFGVQGTALAGQGAAGGYDLLSALLHEQGHVIGLADVPGAGSQVMNDLIAQGARRLPSGGLAAGAVAGSIEGDHFLGGLKLPPDPATEPAPTGGTGTFSNSGQTLGTHKTLSVALGDVDGDGDLDLVQGNYGQANRVWRNNGSGTFSNSGQALGNHYTQNVALGDVDGDSDLDLFESNNFGPSRVWLNSGVNTGTFVDSGQTFGGDYTLSVALGDVDGDGDLDVVEAEGGNPGNPAAQANRVWLNNGAGIFSAGLAFGNHNTRSIALGDVDGDADLDVVEGNLIEPNRVWRNNGFGTFTDSGQSLGNHRTYSVVLGDVDSDGDLDFVEGVKASVAGQATRVWLNNGSGSFSAGQVFGDHATNSLALGDVDGDGDLDLVESIDNSGDRVWRNNGLGTFTDSLQLLGGVEEGAGAILGDVDGDGDLDIVEANYEQANRVWINQGSGAVPAPEITVRFLTTNVEIVDGDNSPSGNGSEGTDFGAVDTASGNVTRTYVIKNDGTGTLTLGGQPTLGTGSQFSISALSGNLTLGANETRTFTVSFNPTSDGVKNDTVTIASNDGNEGTYDFQITGNGTSPALPEITVRFQDTNVEIVDGDVTPTGNGSEGTDFGAVDTASGNVTRTYVIKNDGTGTLTLGGQPTLGNGTHYSISALSGNLTLGANETRTFTVSFNPTSDGVKTDTVTIASNDGNEGTYDFLLTGNGTSPVLTPEITVRFQDTNVEIVDGDVTPSGNGSEGTDFGAVDTATGNVTRTYVIKNDGTGTLTLGGQPTLGNGTHFSVSALSGNLTLGANETRTFTVSFNPTSNGVKNDTVTIASNDANEASYDFLVTGNGTSPQVDLSVVKTSPAEQVVQGGAVTYTITVANAGPDTATGARVTDSFSALLGNVTWSAAFSGGATGAGNGTGNIDQLVNLPTGDSIVYTVTATVDAPGTANQAAQAIVTNTARVEVASGDTDTNLANNADTDSDVVILAATGGTGTFAVSGQSLGDHATFSVALGDVDGDGDLDLVEGNYYEANRVWLNDGSGSFIDSGQTLGDHTTASVALGDVDGDGDLDLVEGNFYHDNRVWLNDGSGSFTDSGQALGNQATLSVALGDVDGDGDLDLVEGIRDDANRVWLNDGSGSFTDSGQGLGHYYTYSVALGDVDGDGDLDLVEGNRDQANRVWLNDGSGTFADSGQSLGDHFTYSVALGDVDGDGDLDLVEGNYGQANRVWINNGTGSFTDSGQALGDHATRGVALGDVDGDGDLDLVEGNFNQANLVWINNGSGSFTDSGQTLGNHATTSVALGDVDGDGDLDFVEGTAGQANRVWLNDLAADDLPENSAFVAANGTLVVTGDDDGDTVTIKIVGGNVVISTTDDSVIGGNGTTTNGVGDVVVPLGNLTGIVLDTGDGDDTVNLVNLGNLTGNLTINGGTGQDVVILQGSTTVSGDVDIDGERVFLNKGNLTAGGDIEIQGNDSGNGAANGSVNGLELRDFDLSAGGNITLEGAGGNGSGGSVGGNAGIELSTTSGVTAGGNITLIGTGGTSTEGLNYGVVFYQGSTLSAAGNGSVRIEGAGGTGGNNNDGVYITSGGSGATVANGTLEIVGTGGLGGNSSDGVELSSGTVLVSTGTGAIAISGTGGGGANTTGNNGIIVKSTLISGDAGNITLTGISGAGLSSNIGIDVSGNSTISTDNGGHINLDGTSLGGIGGGNTNIGVRFNTGTSVQVFGLGSAGTLSIDGTGGVAAGTNNNFGVQLVGAARTVNGNLTVNGTGGGSGNTNRGVVIQSTTVEATGTGAVNITGTGTQNASAGNSNDGVSINTGAAGAVKTAGGNLTITGHGGKGATLNHGVRIASSTVNAGTGFLNILGTASGATTGNSNVGVHISGATSALSGAAGSLISGTGGGLTSLTGTLNHGVHIDGSITTILPTGEVQGFKGNGLTSLNRSGKYTP